MMKNLRHLAHLLLLTVLCAHAQAQPSSSAGHSNGASHVKLVEVQKAQPEAEPRARRGSDLRLALQPLKAGAANDVRVVPASQKPGNEGTRVADAAEPDSARERHLTAKEREEMRQQLRQQRIRQLN